MERIKNIECALSKNEGKNKILFDETNFLYPTYVAIFETDFTYEYILLNEKEFEIIYVFLQFTDIKNVKFSKELLPLNYESYMKVGNRDKSFSIYTF